MRNSVHPILAGLTQSVCTRAVCVWSINDSPQRAPTASDLCFHFLVEHRQPMDAHRLMSTEARLPPTPTHHTHTHHCHISSGCLWVYIYIMYMCTICVFVMCACSIWGCVCVRVWVCGRACLRVHAGWSLCVVSPNWGSNTAVLSLALPSFFPTLCQLDSDKHRGGTERVQCLRSLRAQSPYVV